MSHGEVEHCQAFKVIYIKVKWILLKMHVKINEWLLSIRYICRLILYIYMHRDNHDSSCLNVKMLDFETDYKSRWLTSQNNFRSCRHCQILILSINSRMQKKSNYFIVVYKKKCAKNYFYLKLFGQQHKSSRSPKNLKELNLHKSYRWQFSKWIISVFHFNCSKYLF